MDIPTGYTPGPWQTGEMLPSVVFTWNLPPDHEDAVICEARNPANARLIALAPEMASEIARLDAALAEMTRRRDEWQSKAEGYEAVRLALREKVGSPWPPNLSRALWAGIAADEKKRADDAEAERDRLRAALAWYGEQARLARLVHPGGDAGRHALADDGGKRARAALKGDPNA